MTNRIYVVLIKDSRTETVEVARAFTRRIDAEAFIAECERVETSSNYGYRIQDVKFDGGPMDPY
jgi:hypothetical protein